MAVRDDRHRRPAEDQCQESAGVSQVQGAQTAQSEEERQEEVTPAHTHAHSVVVKMMSLPVTLRSSEVVVVKAKLKLMSLSGVVAALGVLVLLAGLLLAALGYWPRHGLLFSMRPQEGATSTSSTPAPSHLQVGVEKHTKHSSAGLDLLATACVQVGGVSGALEQTGSVNGTSGFLAHFLAR